MTRKDQNTMPTGGRSSAGKAFRPWTSPSHSCVRIRLASFGMPISKRLVSLAESGIANSSSGSPRCVSQAPSIAATFTGWCSSVFRPWRSPMKACSGAMKNSITRHIFSALRLGSTACRRRM